MHVLIMLPQMPRRPMHHVMLTMYECIAKDLPEALLTEMSVQSVFLGFVFNPACNQASKASRLVPAAWKLYSHVRVHRVCVVWRTMQVQRLAVCSLVTNSKCRTGCCWLDTTHRALAFAIPAGAQRVQRVVYACLRVCMWCDVQSLRVCTP